MGEGIWGTEKQMTKHRRWLWAICIFCVLVSFCQSDVIAKTNSNLKVLDITFEPIRRGKNIVYVKVQNLSSQDQTLKIHIYTRSPRLGKSGVGWGMSFFDTIKGTETKRARFVFKIQGEITDDTWLRLGFSNPDSKQDSESKKFLENRYTSKNLPREISGDTPVNKASKEQTKEAFNTFKSVQGHIKKAEYEATWGMFTWDYQEAEFHGKFDIFQKAMNKVMPWSSFYWDKDVFLSLKPAKTFLSGDQLILEVASEDARWTVDLVEVDGKWKIDWIGDYTAAIVLQANWQERLLPKMEKRSTEHFDIYYFKNSTAEKEINKIAEQREKGYAEVCQFTGKQSNGRIRLIFFETGDTKRKETGHQGNGWAFGNNIVEVYNDQVQLDPYHETVHVIMRDFGNPPAMFNEGFAVYLSEKLGAHALEHLSGGLATIYERARELKAKGKWIGLEELITYTEIGSLESRPPVSYAEASAFVKFLIDKYGKDKFLQAYKTLKNSDKKSVQWLNIKALQRIYGKSLKQLEKQWYNTLLN